MELLIGWISTIIGSSIIRFGTIMTIVKDIADQGYLLDFTKMNNINNLNFEENTGAEKIVDYVPGINILNSMKIHSDYINDRERNLSELSILDIVKEMDEDEKNKYEINPTMFNALKITLNRGKKLREERIEEELRYTYEKIHHYGIIKEYMIYFNDMEKSEEEYLKDKDVRLSDKDPDLEEKLKNYKYVDLKEDGKIYYTIDNDKEFYSLDDYRVVYIEGKYSIDEVTFNERKVGYFLSIMDKDMEYKKTINGYKSDPSKKYIKVRK